MIKYRVGDYGLVNKKELATPQKKKTGYSKQGDINS